MASWCERDPGGETKEFGGKLTKGQCIANYLRSEGRATMAAEANCRAGTASCRYGDRQVGKARFQLEPEADTSCTSGMPPLVEQLKLLCPAAAKRLKIE